MADNIIEQVKRGLEGFAIGVIILAEILVSIERNTINILEIQIMKQENTLSLHLLVCWVPGNRFSSGISVNTGVGGK